MTRPKLTLALGLVLIAACAGSQAIPARTGNNEVTYPITVHRWMGVGTCVVQFSRDTVKVRRGWTVKFEMHNNCGTDYAIAIADKEGLFEGTSAPVNVPANGTASLSMVVKSAAPYRHYKCDVVFKGKNEDPDFEVEPGI